MHRSMCTLLIIIISEYPMFRYTNRFYKLRPNEFGFTFDGPIGDRVMKGYEKDMK